MSGAVRWAGGRIFTGRRYVEAIVVEDGRVVFAGAAPEARRQSATGAERVDLAGRLAVPGLTDAHVHPGELARLASGLDLSEVEGTDALLAALRGRAARGPGAIVARKYVLATTASGAWPTADVLDRAVDDRPVVVYDASGHVALLNGRARDRLEELAPGSGPTSEGIRRDGSGRPTGVLVEEAARRFGPAVVGREPIEEEALRSILERLVRWGVTTVGAMSVGPEELEAHRARPPASSAALPRVRAFVRLVRFAGGSGWKVSPGRPELAVVGAKEFLDGAFGPRTAALLGPYDDAPATSGVAVHDRASAAEFLREAANLGLGAALHAIGDRAAIEAARAWEAVPAPRPGPARLEHASLLTPPALAAVLAARPIVAVQPGFLLTDTWLSARLGPIRARWAYPFRTLTALGLTLAGSSDAPYGPLDPWTGMRAAVYRRDPLGRSANLEASERLAPETALGLYLRGAAEAVWEPTAGSLEPGGRGDVVALDAPTIHRALDSGASVRAVWKDGVPIVADPGRAVSPGGAGGG